MKKKIILSILLISFIFSVSVFADNTVDQPKTKEAAKYMKKGNKALKKNKIEKATEYFQKVIELEKDYAPAYFKYAYILNTKKDSEGALTNLKKALELKPGYKHAVEFALRIMSQKAKALNKAGKHAESIKVYEEMIALPGFSTINNPLKIKITLETGFYAYNTRNIEKAYKYLNAFLKDPESKTPAFANMFPRAIFTAANTALQMKKTADANSLYKEYLTLLKDKPADLFTVLANFYIADNNYKAFYAEIVPVNADKKLKDKALKLAEIAKKYTDIEPYYNNVINIKIADPKANNLIEQAYVRLGNFLYLKNEKAAAVKTCKAVIERFPSSPDIETYKKFLKDLQTKKKKSKKRRR